MTDKIALRVEDFAALKNKYFRHNDSGEIYKIAEVGDAGVTAYRAEGFGGPAGGEQYLITWNSLRYKHRVMVHAMDVDAKPGDLI